MIFIEIKSQWMGQTRNGIWLTLFIIPWDLVYIVVLGFFFLQLKIYRYFDNYKKVVYSSWDIEIKKLILVEEKKNKVNKNQYIQTLIKINNIPWKIQFIQLKVLTFRFHCTDGSDGLFLKKNVFLLLCC